MRKKRRDSKCCSKICSNKNNYLNNRDYYNQKRKENRQKHRDERSESYIKNEKRKKEYYEENKKSVREYHKSYYEENKEKILIQSKRYYRNHHPKKSKDCFMKDIEKKIHSNVSRNIRHSLKLDGLSKKRRRWENLVGYSRKELMDHLEKQFVNGMSWDNYGKYGWHIDHIIPKCNFKFNSFDDEEFKE